jgi:RNA polymerase sigma factor (sigma-70 family)
MKDSETSSRAPGLFSATRWSVVLSARDGGTQASAKAMDTLCRTYWYPLYAFARRQGRSPQDAQDLTQEFFSRLIEKDYLQAVVQERGRFRSFLLMALKRFLAKEWDREHAQKRGGGQAFIVLDTQWAERRYIGEGSEHLPPDRIYERRWALTLLEQAMVHLGNEYAVAGESVRFDQLKGWLAANRGEIPYEQVAAELGVSEGAARVAVHRMRQRFRELFREEVAATVSTEEEVEDEMGYVRWVLTG